MSERVVIPELLDHLPSVDPEALRSRRDLRRINFLMGNERWVCRTLRRYQDVAKRGIVEIGAGGGELCGQLARMFPDAPVAAYDLSPRPADLHSAVAWQQGDIFRKRRPESGGVLVANLFLHHFEEESLSELGLWFLNFDLLVINEPDRARLPHLLGGLLHPCVNRVTRHDMHVSIRAGFSDGEISHFLKLDSSHWTVRENSTWRGARRVIACRS